MQVKITKIGEGSKILFVKHPKRGWEIPGGHLLQDETPEQAIIRELKEETGCDGKLIAWNKEYYPEGWLDMLWLKIPKKRYFGMSMMKM